jgi:hypothetical protein
MRIIVGRRERRRNREEEKRRVAAVRLERLTGPETFQNDDPRDYYERWSHNTERRELGLRLRGQDRPDEMELRDRWGEFLLRWVQRFGHRTVMTKDLEPLLEFIPGVWDWSPRSVGLVLRAKHGKTFGSYKLVRLGYTGGRCRWRVENVAPLPPKVVKETWWSWLTR